MKNILKVSLLLLSVSFFAHAVPYGEWEHIRLLSKQGAEIKLDYKVVKYGYYGTSVVNTSDLWIHVNRRDLNSDSKVRVVLMNFSYNNPNVAQTEYYDLQYAGHQHFMLNPYYRGANLFNARQELAS
jgi:hypothetical protein